MKAPERLWWLSFSGDEGFRAACIVEAPAFLEAVGVAYRKGLNPGGEVLGFDLQGRTMEELTANGYELDRLYQKAELEAKGPIMRLDAEGIPCEASDCEGSQ